MVLHFFSEQLNTCSSLRSAQQFFSISIGLKLPQVGLQLGNQLAPREQSYAEKYANINQVAWNISARSRGEARVTYPVSQAGPAGPELVSVTASLLSSTEGVSLRLVPPQWKLFALIAQPQFALGWSGVLCQFKSHDVCTMAAARPKLPSVG